MRQRFQCLGCDLRIEGRQMSDGRIMPYDRAPSDPKGKPLPFICSHCREYPTEKLLNMRAQEQQEQQP